MKKILLSLTLLSAPAWAVVGSSVQPIVTPGQVLFGSPVKTITSTGTVTISTVTGALSVQNIIINGTCAGSGCGSGGGGGSSSIEVMANGIRVSSPTVTLSVLGNASTIITGTLVSGPTAQVTVVVSPSSGTLQGNTFNGTRQLIQTDSSGHLPALSGVNLTNLTGANVGSGVPAANIASGILGASVQASSVATNSVGVQQMNFGAGASASTFARGDGTWATPSGGGGTSGTVVSANQFSMPYYNVPVSSNSLAAFPGITLSTNTGVYIATVTYLGASGFAVSITSNAIVSGTTFYQDGTIKTNLTASLPVQTDAGSRLTAAAINLSGTQATGTMAAARMPALTGDITTSAGAVATTAAAAQANITTLTSATGVHITSNTVLSGATFYQNGPINFSNPLSLGSNQIHLVTDPTSAQDAATKNYVDSVVNGIDYKPAAYLATTGALPANLYNNGASGVGATLTGVSVGALTVDNQVVSTTNRILVQNESDQVNNGIYSVTTVGSGIAAYVLTRSVDYNQSSEITAGDAVFVTSGTANTATGWVMTNAGFATIGVSTITWSQFTGGGGSGITALTGDVTAAGTGSVAATAAANQPNITTLSSVSGITVTNSLSAGSLQLQSASGNTILNSGNTFEIEPSTYLYLSVSTTTAVVSLNPFGGLSFAMAANEIWKFHCMMALQGAAGGHKFGINGPSGATVQAQIYGASSSATGFVANGITALNTANASGFATVPAAIMGDIDGTMANGSTAGSWQLLRESATGGDSVTISSGSYCDATRISP